mmetsp:Transcript_13298/g.2091  ORF Transcript_13298/g.2091 Transcript_13298/m.2091 type:complete len:98 (+) Transcript_13298:1012-1305(+)
MRSNISPMDIARPSQRECLLFVLQLYQGLPHYIPKQTIAFPCILGEKITKTIELTNPANRPVSYFVNLEGSTDFFVDENIEYVTIPSRSSSNFPVYF